MLLYTNAKCFTPEGGKEQSINTGSDLTHYNLAGLARNRVFTNIAVQAVNSAGRSERNAETAQYNHTPPGGYRCTKYIVHAYLIPSAVEECIRGSCAPAFKWGRIILPLIGATFSKCSSLRHTLSTQNALTTTKVSIYAWFTPYCSSISLATSGPDSSTGLTPSLMAASVTPTCPQSTPTASCQPSPLINIMIAVGATTVLLLVVVVVVVVVGLVVIMVTVVRRRQSEEHVDENNSTDRSVRVQMTTNSLQSTTYYEPISPNIGPSHLHHQPHPLHIPHIDTSNIGDDITMEDCPAYQSMDIHTSGEYTYI